MQIKVNIPLIDKITGIFSKAGLPERKPRREDTTETSRTLAWYYYKQLQIERTRLARYGDYRLMDEDYVEICSFLDIYADYATKDLGESGDAFEIFSESKKAQNILDELAKRTKLQETLWDTARNVVHMGDEFDEVIIGGEKWIERLKKLEPEQMKYDIDEYGLPREEPIIQIDPMSTSKIVGFKPWQIVHWKLGGAKRKYGVSILKPIRRVYKQLQMIEDGMVISRLTRAHLRFLFLVDVEGMTPEEAEDHLRKVKEDTKKKRMTNPYTGQLETEQNPLCLSGDTKIPLLDGRELTICELMSEFKDGETFWIYASDGINIVPALATKPWKSEVSAEIVKVNLDNGCSVKCTPSHKFMMRDGSWKEAKDLVEGDSLMPLYRETDERDYELVYPAKDGNTFLHTHKVVAAHLFPESWRHTKLRTTHHKNFNRRDNRPENLDVTSWWNHRKLHVGLLETTIHRPEAKEKSRMAHRKPEYLTMRAEISRRQMQAVYADPVKSEIMKEACRKLLKSLNYCKNDENKIRAIREYNIANRDEKSRILTEYNKSDGHRESARKACSLNGKKIWESDEFRKRKSAQVSELMKKLWRDPEWRNRMMLQRKERYLQRDAMVSNHKVISVEPFDREDVYDLKVETYHCLALSAGVIVHNSAQEDFYMTTRKDSSAGVQALQGAMNLGNIRDVEYIQNKLFVGLGPKSLLGIGGDIEAKATTIEQMINFARRVGRIRKALRAGINQIGNYQLTLLGEVPHPGLYDIKFAAMSMVDELRKWTMEKLKAEVAQIYRMGAGVPLTDEYILKNFVGVADEDIPALLGAPKPEVAARGAGGNGNLALRQSGLTGTTTPSATAMNPKKTTEESYEGNGFHMATLQLMNLVETMRDLVSLELNR